MKKNNSDPKTEQILSQSVTYQVSFYTTFLPSSLTFLVSAFQDTQKLIGYREIKPDIKKGPGNMEVFNQC